MIYLNNAATTFPKPQETIDAVTTYLGSTPFNCLRTGYTGQEEDVILACRKSLAALFNVDDPERMIFTSGATESLNLVIKGLDLEGGHVITTQIEHNSVLRPLYGLERAGKIELSIVECDKYGHVDLADIEKNIRKNTRAVVINHASNVTGEIQDLRSISKITVSGKLILIVDASQSAGCIPIDVKKDSIDILAFTGHKSLYGIPGTGGVYIREGIQVRPFKEGGTGTKSELLEQPEEVPLRYEAGTPNIPGIVALGAGANFIIKTGMNRIHDRKKQHFLKLMDTFCDIHGIKIYGKHGSADRLPVFCFNIEGISSEEASAVLEGSFDIIVRSGLHCAPLIHKALGTYPAGSIRISPSYFTTDDEIERFIYAVKTISEGHSA